ncbi:MAG: SDR family oxidoreductase, partial [Hyphomicrobiales bacterium]|nr:SDR family oxidoreductase [Hyphomicrobiales bacterium]
MSYQFAIYPSLENTSVIISGGASGIGAEIVSAFAAQKSKVGFLDIDETSGAELANRLGDNVHFARCDLRDVDNLRGAIGELTEKIGAPTVLVNNAARDDRHDWTDVTPEYYDERVAVNLRHHFFAIQAVAPGMIAAGGGSIINMGSNSWWEACGGFPVYAMAKSA